MGKIESGIFLFFTLPDSSSMSAADQDVQSRRTQNGGPAAETACYSRDLHCAASVDCSLALAAPMARLLVLVCMLAVAGSISAARPVSEASRLQLSSERRHLSWSLFSKAPSNSPEAIAEEEHQRARDKLVTVRSYWHFTRIYRCHIPVLDRRLSECSLLPALTQLPAIRAEGHVCWASAHYQYLCFVNL